MRLRLAALAALVLVSGCGGEPLPDEATSRQLITTTVLEWHRVQAEGDGVAGCALMTDEQKETTVESDRNLLKSPDTPPADSCVEAIARFATFPDTFRALMRNTQVDAVQIDDDRATATVHTSAAVDGVTRQTPPAHIPLRWVDGRWLID